ncbi:MAG: APC family permease [Gammaproteobacteria bacterium]|nr:APC family permease [Gammaproteobacteria bacterium]
MDIAKVKRWLFGAPRDPLNPHAHSHIALIAFFAWIGLGADGLSSSCYGPEEAFIALGVHAHIALYLAVATALTVFIISIAYNQVIELFPGGGGGYRVATVLLGPYAGLVSGSALIVDYMLTIAISIASGCDALFSLMPHAYLPYKFSVEVFCTSLLIFLNMRGMKESIRFLMPIFLGFMITHIFLIVYGVGVRGNFVTVVVQDTLKETYDLSQQVGWVFVISLFLRAYSLGGGTYTGIEAVSNNVNRLASPRIRTGKWTTLYMAVSLSFTAAGIILLYLLWGAKPELGQTLNAVVFKNIMADWPYRDFFLMLILVLEAGLLFVAANTGFLGGPAVLASMALDAWVPNRFKHLSSRLVTQNGVLVFGIAALLILWWTHGSVSLLIVLYSTNVFLTFSLSLLGLTKHWLKNYKKVSHWATRLSISAFGFLITTGILGVTVSSKFKAGGWLTMVVTGTVIALCLLIHMHYRRTKKKLKLIDAVFATIPVQDSRYYPKLDPTQATAVFFVGKNKGPGMHTLLWAQRMFPEHFKNFIFLSAGEVDVENFGVHTSLVKMQQEVEDTLQYFIDFCHYHHLAAKAYSVYGTDPVSLLDNLAEKINTEFPNCIFFASKLVFENDSWVTRLLHNETPNALQRKLHLKGIQMVILPMRI